MLAAVAAISRVAVISVVVIVAVAMEVVGSIRFGSLRVLGQADHIREPTLQCAHTRDQLGRVACIACLKK